ncbi:MAG TPA: patatin-like phospholipase family protein [Bacteroidia bacterium]|nr:patatin-like phospholipase family protein [Bacteroidia bacterium]
MSNNSMDVALVLSGGVARGLSHIGTYKALNEFGVVPKIIAGTSAGAIIGAFIAKGFHADEIASIASKTNIISIRNFNPGNLGLFKPHSIKRNLQKYLGNINFDDLQVELVVAATDIKHGKPYYIKNGPLVPALLATSAIPVIYKPVIVNNTLLIDGGISDNFAVEAISPCKYKIIGCHANPLGVMEKDLSYKALIDRCISVALHKDILHKKHLCDIFIEPPQMANYGMFQIKKAQEIIQIGYDYTKSLAHLFQSN